MCLKSQIEIQVSNPNLAFYEKKLYLKVSLLVLNHYNMQHLDEAETGLSAFETQLPTVIHGLYTNCMKDECHGFLSHLAHYQQQIC